MNVGLSRFFRNLSRYKSRKRVLGNEQALIPLILGTETEQAVDFENLQDDGFTMTPESLRAMNVR